MTMPKEAENPLKPIFTAATIFVVLFLVFSYFLAMFLGPTLFFFTPNGSAVSMRFFSPLRIYLFVVIRLDVPVWLNVALFLLLMWSVYSLCLIAAYKLRISLIETVRNSFSRPTRNLLNNCLFAIPIITSTLFTTVIGIHALEEKLGIPIGSGPLEPSSADPLNPFKNLVSLTYSPLFEEIGFFITPIGAFLIAYLFWVGRRNISSFSLGRRLRLFFTALLYPEKAKKMVGVKTLGEFGLKGGVSRGEWVMIAFTSVAFGLTHYLWGSGWEVGKITSSSVVGLALGLSYLAYGVQAPIIIHWFFDYYWYAYSLASDVYPVMFPIFRLIYTTTIMFGMLGWLTFTILGLNRVVTRTKKVTFKTTSSDSSCLGVKNG